MYARLSRECLRGELSRPFCAAYRVVDRDPTGHDGAVLMSIAPVIFHHFALNPNGSGAMMVLTLCRELALLAVRCERRRQARSYRSRSIGIDDTYAATCVWQAAKRSRRTVEREVNPRHCFVRAVKALRVEEGAVSLVTAPAS